MITGQLGSLPIGVIVPRSYPVASRQRRREILCISITQF